LTAVDVFALAGGRFAAHDLIVPITVTDGTLDIDFLKGAADNPNVAAIRVDTAARAIAAHTRPVMRADGDAIRIEWNGLKGMDYTLSSSRDLSQWEAVDGFVWPMAGDGATMSLLDSTGNPAEVPRVF
jgi:hypothetical protein